MTVGQKIKKLRTEKGFTQKELSDQLFVSFQTISKWENGENEPDISTLRQLAKLFDCSVDYLVSEDDEEVKPVAEQAPVVEPAPVQVVEKETVIIKQGELHVCAHCKKDIQPEDLEIDHVPHNHRVGRHTHTTWSDQYYHKDCLAEVRKNRKLAERAKLMSECSKHKKRSFGWGIAAGAIGQIVSLLVFLLVPVCQQALNPFVSVLLSTLIAYGLFSAIYCIVSGSYIADFFIWCATSSIKLPGLIFSWDLDGFIWVISMKILFAIITFLFGLAAFTFGLVGSMALGMISFPFVLIHNNNTYYEGAF